MKRPILNTKPVYNRTELAKLFNELGFKYGAEIGVASGRYSEILCRNIPGLKLLCIDPWDEYLLNRRGGDGLKHQGNYLKTKQRLENYNATLIRKFSVDASRDVEDESLDFVFIDGNHDFDFVLEDIITWNRKVRKGGIISGHDYYQFRHSGVIEAVNAYVNFHKIELNLTCGCINGRRDDKKPSFWWVKE